jgi:hypothetical protein
LKRIESLRPTRIRTSSGPLGSARVPPAPVSPAAVKATVNIRAKLARDSGHITADQKRRVKEPVGEGEPTTLRAHQQAHEVGRGLLPTI